MRVGEFEVNVYDKGTGPVVLFLHGWGTDFTSFRVFLDRMSEAYRVCAPDMPGFGKTAEPPCAWGVDDYADFVLDCLAKLGIDEAILIGHSFGGGVGVKLAAREGSPLRIPKMILVDGKVIRPRRTPAQRLRTVVYRLGRNLLQIEAVQKRFPDLLERWRRSHGSADYRSATPRMRECLVKIVGEDLTPCLPRVACPTLLIWGENDTATTVADARIMEKLIPDAGLVVLKNAGHYSFLDQSYTFGRVLDSFLNMGERG